MADDTERKLIKSVVIGGDYVVEVPAGWEVTAGAQAIVTIERSAGVGHSPPSDRFLVSAPGLLDPEIAHYVTREQILHAYGRDTGLAQALGAHRLVPGVHSVAEALDVHSRPDGIILHSTEGPAPAFDDSPEARSIHAAMLDALNMAESAALHIHHAREADLDDDVIGLLDLAESRMLQSIARCKTARYTIRHAGEPPADGTPTPGVNRPWAERSELMAWRELPDDHRITVGGVYGWTDIHDGGAIRPVEVVEVMKDAPARSAAIRVQRVSGDYVFPVYRADLRIAVRA